MDMRPLLPFFLVFLAGCSTLPNSDVSTWRVDPSQATYVLPAGDVEASTLSAFAAPALYIVAVPVNDGTCYIRVRDGLTDGQICTFGDFVRYSPDAPLSGNIQPIPSLVLGLFDSADATDQAR